MSVSDPDDDAEACVEELADAAAVCEALAHGDADALAGTEGLPLVEKTPVDETVDDSQIDTVAPVDADTETDEEYDDSEEELADAAAVCEALAHGDADGLPDEKGLPLVDSDTEPLIEVVTIAVSVSDPDDDAEACVEELADAAAVCEALAHGDADGLPEEKGLPLVDSDTEPLIEVVTIAVSVSDPDDDAEACVEELADAAAVCEALAHGDADGLPEK